MKLEKEEYKEIAVTAARACDDKKAEDVKVLDLCGKSALAEYIVMAVIESAPQLEAAEQGVIDALKKDGTYCLHKDGMNSKNWRVLDYGGVIVHVFDRGAAEFYSIEKIYSGTELVDWKIPEQPKKKSVKTAAKKAAAKTKKVSVKKVAVKRTASKKTGKSAGK